MMPRSPVRRCWIPFAVVLLVVAPAQPARSATFTVDSTLDAVDAAPLDGVCATAGGACTLRAAVQTANGLAGADQIVLLAGTYTLTIAGTQENAAAEGDLDVRDDVTIAGADAATTIIDGGHLDRVLDAEGVSLDVRDLTIRNGFVGIVGDGAALTLERTIVTGNSGGSGIYLLAENSDASCLVTDSTISNNHASSNGGGIFANSVFASASVTVRRSTISGNSATQGGGIAGGAAIAIDECTLTGNHAVTGGGIFMAAGVLTLTRSTVTGNSASYAGGGAIASGAGVIENTTFSGNTSNGDFGGLGGGGTGLRVRNVTITDNVADADSNGSGDGGGFGGSNEISNSIIAGNVDRGGEADDCTGAITSGGFDLIERAETCVIDGDSTGNVLGLPAALGPLAMNGGPTETHALLSGSPALDAGNPAPPASGPTACAAADQRSVARPHAVACDMGAVEEPYVVSDCGNGVGDAGEQCDDGNVRDGDCCTATCQLAAPGALCTDANVCTDNACDGSGACVATNNTAACNDDVFCTVGETCWSGSCGGGTPNPCQDGISCTNDFCHPTFGCVHLVNDSLCADGDPCTTDVCEYPIPYPPIGCFHYPATGPACDDGNLCTPTDTCQGGACIGSGHVGCDDCLACDPDTGCTILGPEPQCSPPTGLGWSTLELKDAADDKADKLKWTWKSNDGTSLADFGTPTGSTTYDLCVYDQSAGSPSLVFRASPAAGMCGAVPCWKSGLKSHVYKDRAGSSDGLTGIKLQSPAFPKARITITGKGAKLPNFGLPMAADPAVLVQLRSSNGGCWGASFGSARINAADHYKAKSD